ncbi:MAG: hypothetical protein ACRDPA_22790 [Solirubrobacteraceae bacterium]
MTTSPDITTSPHTILALRVAGLEDASVLRRLAALDDAPPLDGPVLLALLDGTAIAAMSLRDGRVVADPFRPTADIVRLLALRARQLTRDPRSPAPNRRQSPWTGRHPVTALKRAFEIRSPSRQAL